MDALELLNEIRALEETLHRPEIRRSNTAVGGLLCDGFVEFGSSGKVYQRQEIIDLLAREDEAGDAGRLQAADYAIRAIAEGAVLLTYRTRRTTSAGAERQVLRSSIWQKTEAGWQMLFHQGTVIA
jgi:hypothetical protein